MTKEEYLGDWYHYMDARELDMIMSRLKQLYGQVPICPHFKDVFKAFELCPYNELKVVVLGQDPYPQKDVATGLAFANKKGTDKLSPSLEVIKNSFQSLQNQKDSTNFAPDLESWAKQGVLLLNSSLTVEQNKPGSHFHIWKRFIASFLKNLSEANPGLIYVLMGTQAETFRPFIGKFNDVLICKHPSFYARNNIQMPDIFSEVDALLLYKNNFKINWYGKQEDKECNQEDLQWYSLPFYA